MADDQRRARPRRQSREPDRATCPRRRQIDALLESDRRADVIFFLARRRSSRGPAPRCWRERDRSGSRGASARAPFAAPPSSPRSFSGRSKSSRPGSPQLDLAWRRMARRFTSTSSTGAGAPAASRSLDPRDRLVERHAADRDAGREGRQQPRRHRRRQDHEQRRNRPARRISRPNACASRARTTRSS